MSNSIQRDQLKQLCFTTCVVINMRSPHFLRIFSSSLSQFLPPPNFLFLSPNCFPLSQLFCSLPIVLSSSPIFLPLPIFFFSQICFFPQFFIFPIFLFPNKNFFSPFLQFISVSISWKRFWHSLKHLDTMW